MNTFQSSCQDPYKITIITVVLNNLSGFTKTAKSILSQTSFERIEWIVIDGGSRDGTKEAILAYDNDISYWVSEPDKGIYDGMNKGIRQAKGLYTLFLNAGDSFVQNDTIEHVLQIINSKKTIDYFSGNAFLTQNGKLTKISTPPRVITGLYLFKHSLCHQSTFIRTTRLLQWGGYDNSFKIVADAKFFFEDIVLRGATYFCMDFPVCYYDIDGISSIHYMTTLDERNRFLHQLLPPVIYNDYIRLAEGETTLEKILCKQSTSSLFYRWMTCIAVISFAPISFINRIKMKWNNKIRKK